MSRVSTVSFIEHLQQCELIDEKGAQQLRSLTQNKSDSALAVASRTGMVPEQALVNALSDYTGWPIVNFAELSSLEPQIIEALDTLQLQSNWCQREGLIRGVPVERRRRMRQRVRRPERRDAHPSRFGNEIRPVGGRQPAIAVEPDGVRRALTGRRDFDPVRRAVVTDP